MSALESALICNPKSFQTLQSLANWDWWRCLLSAVQTHVSRIAKAKHHVMLLPRPFTTFWPLLEVSAMQLCIHVYKIVSHKLNDVNDIYAGLQFGWHAQCCSRNFHVAYVWIQRLFYHEYSINSAYTRSYSVVFLFHAWENTSASDQNVCACVVYHFQCGICVVRWIPVSDLFRETVTRKVISIFIFVRIDLQLAE